jgi:Zn-dependent protease
MDLGPEQLRWIVQALIILVLSICVHEFGHAFIADKLGDALPRSQGRVTLNPLAHADPLGTFVFPLAALVLTKGTSTGFGWGRPVEVMPHRMNRRISMRRAHMLVAAAGPLMNLGLAFVIMGVHLVLVQTGTIAPTHGTAMVPTTAHGALQYAAYLNLVLMFFNLIPAPPLDGGTVLLGLVPDRTARKLEQVAKFGPFLLLGIIFIPGISRVFTVPAAWIYGHVALAIGLPT